MRRQGKTKSRTGHHLAAELWNGSERADGGQRANRSPEGSAVVAFVLLSAPLGFAIWWMLISRLLVLVY